MALTAQYNFETLTLDSVGSNTLVNGGTVVQGAGLFGYCMQSASGKSMRRVADVMTLTRASTITASFWLYTDNIIDGRIGYIMLLYGAVGVLNVYATSSGGSGGYIGGYIQRTFNTTTQATFAVAPPHKGWIHLVVTMDGANSLKAYLHGVECDSKTPTDTADTSYTATLRIGNETNLGTTNYFDGKIERISLDKAVWSPGAIKNEYSYGMGFF